MSDDVSGIVKTKVLKLQGNGSSIGLDVKMSVKDDTFKMHMGNELLMSVQYQPDSSSPDSSDFQTINIPKNLQVNGSIVNNELTSTLNSLSFNQLQPQVDIITPSTFIFTETGKSYLQSQGFTVNTHDPVLPSFLTHLNSLNIPNTKLLFNKYIVYQHTRPSPLLNFTSSGISQVSPFLDSLTISPGDPTSAEDLTAFLLLDSSNTIITLLRLNYIEEQYSYIDFLDNRGFIVTQDASIDFFSYKGLLNIDNIDASGMIPFNVNKSDYYLAIEHLMNIQSTYYLQNQYIFTLTPGEAVPIAPKLYETPRFHASLLENNTTLTSPSNEQGLYVATIQGILEYIHSTNSPYHASFMPTFFTNVFTNVYLASCSPKFSSRESLEYNQLIEPSVYGRNYVYAFQEGNPTINTWYYTDTSGNDSIYRIITNDEQYLTQWDMGVFQNILTSSYTNRGIDTSGWETPYPSEDNIRLYYLNQGLFLPGPPAPSMDILNHFVTPKGLEYASSFDIHKGSSLDPNFVELVEINPYVLTTFEYRKIAPTIQEKARLHIEGYIISFPFTSSSITEHHKITSVGINFLQNFLFLLLYLSF